MSYPPPHDPHQQPYQAPQPPYFTGGPTMLGPVMSQPAQRRRKLPFILAGAGVVLVLCCGGGLAASLSGGSTDSVDEPSAAQQSQIPAKRTGTKFTLPPRTEPKNEPTAPPTTAAPKPTATKTTAPKPKKVSYDRLTSRQWKKIAKDPDAHIGDTILIYGTVTQFDAATGTDMFRADVGPADEDYSFEYPTNTMLNGSAAALDDLVEDDEFRAKVRVTGSYSYDTQVGGNTTVPQLEVESIRVL